MIKQLTFERTCSGYLLVSVAAALLIPSNFSIEPFLPFTMDVIPFANNVWRIPGRLNSTLLYFSLMWLMLPLVVLLFALKPQAHNAVEKASGSPLKAFYATLVAFAILMFVGSTFYLNLSSLEPSSRGIALFLVMARYKLGLGAAGGVLMLTTALSIYLAIVLVPQIWLATIRHARRE